MVELPALGGMAGKGSQGSEPGLSFSSNRGWRRAKLGTAVSFSHAVTSTTVSIAPKGCRGAPMRMEAFLRV